MKSSSLVLSDQQSDSIFCSLRWGKAENYQTFGIFGIFHQTQDAAVIEDALLSSLAQKSNNNNSDFNKDENGE